MFTGNRNRSHSDYIGLGVVVNKMGVLLFSLVVVITIIGSVLFLTRGMIYNYVNSKLFFIEFGALGIIILGVFLVTKKDIVAFVKSSLLVKLSGLFLIISWVAALLGKDVALSLFSHFERGTGLIVVTLSFIAAFFIALIQRKYSLGRSITIYPLAFSGGALGFLLWIGISGLNLPIWSLLGKSSGGGATLGNSSFAGTLLLISFFVIVYAWFTEQVAWRKNFLALLGFFTLINPVLVTPRLFSPLAGSLLGIIGDARGATISIVAGLVVGVGVYLWLSRNSLLKVMGKVVVGLIAAIVVVVGVTLFMPKTATHDFFVKTTGEARFIYWKMAGSQLMQYPILGTGWETFRYAHERFFDDKLLLMGEPWADKPHNAYLEIGLSTGILGLGVYGVLIGVLLRRFVRQKDSEDDRMYSAVFSGLFVAYLINNFILFDTVTSMFWFWLLIMMTAGRFEYSPSSETDLQKKSEWWRLGVVIVCVGVIVFVSVPQLRKTMSAWDELFDVVPSRTETYQKTERLSLYGAGISFPQRAGDYAQQYVNKTTLSEDEFRDIAELSVVLLDGMNRFPPNMQSYIALGDLARAALIHFETPPELFVNQLKLAGEGIQKITTKNPKDKLFIDEANQYVLGDKK